MTQKLFWSNPYSCSHQSYVNDVYANEIQLESTIFFAFSGGQESDRGTIAGFEVLLAEKREKNIIYRLNENHTVVKGQLVQIEIDWVRRYRLMRLHFAAEIVLELIMRRFYLVGKTGAHISQNKARIDFASDVNLSSSLNVICEDANNLIAEDREIVTEFLDEANEIRYWEVEGFSRVPCGGTHVKSTGECPHPVN